ncbi:FAD-dependent thymidylate synthase [bacterium]|nr:FAD-dependent thymidylate synthase [bacterium]
MNQNFESISRKTVPELDAILGRAFKVLDDGFVRVVDYLGNDAAIVQAARVSYGEGTTKVRQDRTLIRYLLRHQHTSPFEMCEIKLHVRVPMDCWRQWIRHRTASVNEYSTRYSIAIDTAQKTSSEDWRVQSQSNRQGSAGFFDQKTGEKFTRAEAELHARSRKIYEERIEEGMAREQARKDLPLCTYTEAYWKIDLHNLLHFLKLRMELNAQYEIRKFADTIGNEIVKRWVPLTWEAFLDYDLNALRFSVTEQRLLKAMLEGDKKEMFEFSESQGWLKKDEHGQLKPHFERAEFEEKLKLMKVDIPWQLNDQG